MKKLVNVVMLPTEKATNLYVETMGELVYLEESFKCRDNSNQHLYLVSDEEIKVGDYYINLHMANNARSVQTHKEMRHLINHKKDYRFKECKKIIATTDKGLGLPDKYTLDQIHLQMPQIQESFVKAYVEAQGNIKELLVEYKEVENNYGLVSNESIAEVFALHKTQKYYEQKLKELGGPNRTKWQLKTRENNTVIIHQAKTYTREEVENLIEFAWASCSATTYKEGEDIGADCRSWINTHL